VPEAIHAYLAKYRVLRFLSGGLKDMSLKLTSEMVVPTERATNNSSPYPQLQDELSAQIASLSGIILTGPHEKNLD